MNILFIILVIIFFLILFIVFLLIIPFKVLILLGSEDIKVNLFKITIFSIKYTRLLSIILKFEKPKIKIKILPLIKSILYVGINVKYQKEDINQNDAYAYGLFNLLSLFELKRIDRFSYQRLYGENNIKVEVTLKVRLLNLVLSQFKDERSNNYGKVD